ncbi:DUF2059 domain-containing protein [Flavobacterium microcysteis]
MKKLIVTFAFVLATQVGFAQDAAFKNDVKKVIEMTGASAQIDVAKKQILGMIPEAKQAAFLKDFDATMPSYFDKVADVYMKEYTHAEIKEMIKFYETPLGKKITSKAGVLTEKTMEAAQTWGVELQSIMMKYMQ